MINTMALKKVAMLRPIAKQRKMPADSPLEDFPSLYIG